MCGIAGIVDFKNKSVEKGVVERMVSVQKHRGPDDSGFYFGENVAFGHSRLAIIDLSSNAHQPMSDGSNAKWIVHNGEVYNYLELREELIKRGYRFRSSSDTEVILHAFSEWQEEALKRFNGMWAFAVWDAKKRRLFAARDRFGIKPFYYYYDKDLFVFSSEIKALLLHKQIVREPNEQAIYDYLISGYGYMDISDHTFFKNIYQLKPGHYIRIEVPEKKFAYRRYWDLGTGSSKPKKGDEEYINGFNELFRDAVKLRLRSDVKLGVALSGGLDSSSVACVTNQIYKGERLSSFSSCFEEKGSDERHFINDVLDMTALKPHFIFADPGNLFSDMERIIWHQEEPYSTPSIFPQWYIMKLAHEKGVKVLLTGQAGDETLAGYTKYYLYLFADLFKTLKWKRAFKEIKIYKETKDDKTIFEEVLRILLSHFLPRFIKEAGYNFRRDKIPYYMNKDFGQRHKRVVHTDKKFSSILNNDLYNAFKISPLPSLLHIDDRSSMAHSVESRSPFLDYRLVEYAFSLPVEYKIRDGKTKFILREAMRDCLPLSVSTRRDKMGFPTPLKVWLKGQLRERILDIFNSGEFLKRPYFNSEGVKREFDLLLEHDKSNEFTIWSCLNLELWLRRFIDEDRYL